MFLSLHLDMVCNELNSHMPLLQEIRFYIPLESTCCLFFAYYDEFLNRESYDGLVLPAERELQISPENMSYLSSCPLSQR